MSDPSWRQVWNDRDAQRADWNGQEDCFPDLDAYERYVDRVAAHIVQTLGISSEDSVLDLGCGSGRLAQRVAQSAGSVIGIDFSRPALSVAEKLRSAPNITYVWGDLNQLPVRELPRASKAYAAGSLFYLDTKDTVWAIAGELRSRGCDALLIDLPDAEIPDQRPRDYDRAQYRHLSFTEAEFEQRYPGVRFERGLFPEYVNDALRFTVHLGPEGAG